MKLWFTADLHIGHNNIIRYCDRPFGSVGDMHECLIERYNKAVRHRDTCYFVGDIGFSTDGAAEYVISRLNGRKILVLGNHDKHSVSYYYGLGFDAVVYSCEIFIGKQKVELRHVPKRSLLEFGRIIYMYVRTMRRKNRTFKQVIQRVKREWSNYKNADSIWTICGHVHNAWKLRGRNINVGVDVSNFEPVSSDKILDIIRKNT